MGSSRARTRVPRVSRVVARPRDAMGAEGSLAAHLRVLARRAEKPVAEGEALEFEFFRPYGHLRR